MSTACLDGKNLGRLWHRHPEIVTRWLQADDFFCHPLPNQSIRQHLPLSSLIVRLSELLLFSPLSVSLSVCPICPLLPSATPSPVRPWALYSLGFCFCLAMLSVPPFNIRIFQHFCLLILSFFPGLYPYLNPSFSGVFLYLHSQFTCLSSNKKNTSIGESVCVFLI